MDMTVHPPEDIGESSEPGSDRSVLDKAIGDRVRSRRVRPVFGRPSGASGIRTLSPSSTTLAQRSAELRVSRSIAW